MEAIRTYTGYIQDDIQVFSAFIEIEACEMVGKNTLRYRDHNISVQTAWRMLLGKMPLHKLADIKLNPHSGTCSLLVMLGAYPNAGQAALYIITRPRYWPTQYDNTEPNCGRSCKQKFLVGYQPLQVQYTTSVWANNTTKTYVSPI